MLKWALLASVFAHVSLMIISKYTLDRSQEEEMVNAAVEFQVFPAQALPKMKAASKNSVSLKKKSRRFHQNISLKELKPQLSSGISVQSAEVFQKQEFDASEGSWGSEPADFQAQAFMNSMGVGKYLEEMQFYLSIWKRLNRHLDFPSDFVSERLQGKIAMDIIVDEKGRFSGDFLKMNSDHRLLGLYVMSVVLAALKDPIDGRFWLKRKKTPLSLVFDFKIHTHQAPVEYKQGYSQKNALYFQRRRYDTPEAVKAIRKFFTRTMPPIIPFPGGVYVDFIALYEYIKNIGTPDPDVLRFKRLKIKKELWQEMVKKEKGSL